MLLRILSAHEDRKVNTSRRRIHPRLLLLGLALCLAFVAGAPSSFAQTTGAATLRGTVKDPQGAVVPDATVTLINERTREERQDKTSGEGGYVFSALTPGTYTIRVESPGFKVAEQTGVMVETSSTRGVDIDMEVGQATETVTV